MTTLAAPAITAADVQGALSRHLLVDGFDLVLDLEASRGAHLVDARDGRSYLDLFTFFGSSALGMNHPAIARDERFAAELLEAARNKPSCSDVYTVAMARFTDVFARVLGDPKLPHLFFIEGGALAVENALKVAFDWKSRWNEAHGIDPALGTRVLHLREAFHGRSGYTLSLTNTDPVKVERFPRFAWPRIPSPYLSPGLDVAVREAETLAAARAAFVQHRHDIACFIMEPIQAEGALFVLDEVQTGCGLTGTPWAYQQLGVQPDVVAFGKKTQVCGVMAGGRVDEVPDNVFAVSSRINSTWGGSLVDMVRARRVLEVIEDEQLLSHVAATGAQLLRMLEGLAVRHAAVSHPRGRGLMCAFSLPDKAFRDRVLTALREEESVLLLGCGTRSIRFRPALNVSIDELSAGVAALDRVLERLSA